MTETLDELSPEIRKTLKPRQVAWLEKWLPVLRRQSRVNERDQMILDFAGKPGLTPSELNDLATLVKSARADQEAKIASRNQRDVIEADKEKKRKTRLSAMCGLAELLQKAGLADATTGKSIWHTEELLGALLEIAEVQPNTERRKQWRLDGKKALSPSTDTVPTEQRTQAQATTLDAEFDFS